jgi:hypothetical protein
MTDATTEPTKGKGPSHIAYHVKDRDGGKSYWTRIGAMWAHKDGNGFNLEFDLLPLDGRLTLRIPSEKKD